MTREYTPLGDEKIGGHMNHLVLTSDPQSGKVTPYFGFNQVTAFERLVLLQTTFPHLDVYVVEMQAKHHGKRPLH